MTWLTVDAERVHVENRLMANAAEGAVIPGTGGFRKLRVPLAGRGKRSGGRVIYYCIGRRGRIYLLAFFPESVKENLTKAERNMFKTLGEELEAEP